MFDRPVVTLERWDTLEKGGPVVAVAAADAHGGAKARAGSEEGGALVIGPSYEASVRSLSNRLLLERPLTGDANADARLVLDAVRAGRVYSVVDAISSDVLLSLSEGKGFDVASPLPAGAQVFTMTDGNRRRIEVHAARAPGAPPVPWVVSNWAGPREPQITPPREGVSALETTPLPIASEWRVEKDPESSGRVSGAGDLVTLEYKLRGDARASQFAAAVADLRETPSLNHLVFRGRAVKPMRVSVQLRFAPDDARWMTSVPLGPEEREVALGVGEMVPAYPTAGRMPEMSSARSILFVVDLVNARPGDSGAFTVSSLRGAR